MFRILQKRRQWFYLAAAIAAEVTGTVSIKILAMAGAPKPVALLFLYAMIALSYALLSLAIRRVPLALAFALWEGAGIVLVTLSGALLGEEISAARLSAIALMILGIALLKLGAREDPAPETLPADGARA